MQVEAISNIPKIQNADTGNFFLLAGPCAIEGSEMAFGIAERLKDITDRLGIPFVFKGSFRKANRSKLDSFQGIGDIKALEILKAIAEKFDLPTVTDIHKDEDAAMAAKYVDVLQIPAFLCRQTSLLLAAADTQKWVNIKKGQFLSADSMRFPLEKVQSRANNKIMLTERGSFFGYGDLVVDYRSFPIMNKFDAHSVMDCTHSLQQPNQASGVTGGQPALIEVMAKTAIAAGAKGLFIETHLNPQEALSDGAKPQFSTIMKMIHIIT